MVSSKTLTCFSDFRPRPEEPDFMMVTRYLEYLDEYVDRFRLRQYMFLSTRVISLRRREGSNNGHIVRYRQRHADADEVWECDAVAICSGLHVTPAIPKIPGLDRVPVV